MFGPPVQRAILRRSCAMSMLPWIRRLFTPRSKRVPIQRPFYKRLRVEELEDRIAPAALNYKATDGTPLTLQLFGTAQLLQIVNSQTPTKVLASQSLANTTSVQIDANGFNVQLTVDTSVPQVSQGIVFLGGT